MQPIEKLKNRLNDAIEQIELSLETELKNREIHGSLESLSSENLNLKRQIDDLKAELENSDKDDEAHLNFENLHLGILYTGIPIGTVCVWHHLDLKVSEAVTPCARPHHEAFLVQARN